MNIGVNPAVARGLVMLTAALSLIGTAALAEERVVRGKVVKVIPITETVVGERPDTTCSHPKPIGLGELLGWDLLHDCDQSPSEEIVTGYEVFYTWDDRTYSRTMLRHPGATVPLLLTVD